jgi:hypothetical protein
MFYETWNARSPKGRRLTIQYLTMAKHIRVTWEVHLITLLHHTTIDLLLNNW